MTGTCNGYTERDIRGPVDCDDPNELVGACAAIILTLAVIALAFVL